MARLMSEGCDDKASFSADGRGLSLNFCEGQLAMEMVRVSVKKQKHTLSSALPYLFRLEYMGFRSFCTVSSDCLKGSWSFARVKGAVLGSGRVVSLVCSCHRRYKHTHLLRS